MKDKGHIWQNPSDPIFISAPFLEKQSWISFNSRFSTNFFICSGFYLWFLLHQRKYYIGHPYQPRYGCHYPLYFHWVLWCIACQDHYENPQGHLQSNVFYTSSWRKKSDWFLEAKSEFERQARVLHSAWAAGFQCWSPLFHCLSPNSFNTFAANQESLSENLKGLWIGTNQTLHWRKANL